MPLRIIFCGTPEFAVPSLRRLLSDPDFEIAAVVTQPDRPRGRGQEVSAPPVKAIALETGVQVYQPEKIKSDSALDFFTRMAVDAVVIIAYGQIIPARLIALPRLGWINVHGSLLPKYRGAAPIAWAIANGETVTGLTTMQIDAGMDTGPMLLRLEMGIGPDETAPELASRMAEAGAPLIADTLGKLSRGEIRPNAQDSSQASYAPLLKKEHGRIDWSLPARQIYNRMRGFTPWPGAYTSFRGQTCQLWGRPADSAMAAQNEIPGRLEASSEAVYVVCGEGSCLQIEGVQIEGRKRVKAREFVNGARLTPGERFGA
jgi:methionyl-tRNA formyltransferase